MTTIPHLPRAHRIRRAERHGERHRTRVSLRFEVAEALDEARADRYLARVPHPLRWAGLWPVAGRVTRGSFTTRHGICGGLPACVLVEGRALRWVRR